MDTSVADLTALGRTRIGPDDVGHSVYVNADSTWYVALLPGEGLDKWRANIPEAGGIRSYTRTFAFDDSDVAVSSGSVSIDFGEALPAGAIVLSTSADFNQPWSDGDEGTFALNIGLTPAHEYFTASAYDIDGGTTPAAKPVCLPTGNGKGEQVVVTISSSVDLDTATEGVTTIQLVFVVPEDTEYAAPVEE